MEKILSLFITMTMMITPTVATIEPSNSTVETIATIEPAKPTATPTTEPLNDIPIEYDDTEERKSHYMRGFQITKAEKTDGGYSITYTLKTFLEGRGTVGVTFNCYDSNGNVVDTFGGSFVGTDYTWSEHEAQAVISDKTVRIELALN